MALINYHGLVDPARIIHSAVSPLWIYCVSGDGRCWWILFSRGSPGSSREGGSCIVGWWEALSLSGRGELGERRLLRERVVARLNAGGGRWNRGCYEDRHNAQRTTHDFRYCAHGRTQRHTQSSTHRLGEDQLQQLCISWLRTCQIKQDAS